MAVEQPRPDLLRERQLAAERTDSGLLPASRPPDRWRIHDRLGTTHSKLRLRGSKITKPSPTSQYAHNCCYGQLVGDASGPYEPSNGPPDVNIGGLGVGVSDYVAYRPGLLAVRTRP